MAYLLNEPEENKPVLASEKNGSQSETLIFLTKNSHETSSFDLNILKTTTLVG